MKLIFGDANAKLRALETKMKRKVVTFSLLSGHSCPYAKECDSRAVVGGEVKGNILTRLLQKVKKIVKGKRYIVDGPHTLFRCFSASQEVLFTGVYNSRKNNGELVKLAAVSVDAAASEIVSQLPKKAGIVRIHVGGDFQTKAYFHAWLLAAKQKPDVLFYAYTKSLPFWVWAKENDLIPQNFLLTASYGGYKDELIEKHGLRYSKVVFSKAEARKLRLPIDHDDSHAANPKLANKSFALLLHGVQPKGSKASEALGKLEGVGSYGKTGGMKQKKGL